MKSLVDLIPLRRYYYLNGAAQGGTKGDKKMNMTQIRKQFAALKLEVNFAGYVNGNRTYRIAHKESGSSVANGVFTKSGLVEYLEA